jgi:hypothetical protein
MGGTSHCNECSCHARGRNDKSTVARAKFGRG